MYALCNGCMKDVPLSQKIRSVRVSTSTPTNVEYGLTPVAMRYYSTFTIGLSKKMDSLGCGERSLRRAIFNNDLCVLRETRSLWRQATCRGFLPPVFAFVSKK